jgi:hypothetical protein
VRIDERFPSMSVRLTFQTMSIPQIHRRRRFPCDTDRTIRSPIDKVFWAQNGAINVAVSAFHFQQTGRERHCILFSIFEWTINPVSSFSKGVGMFSEGIDSKSIDFNPLCMVSGRPQTEQKAAVDLRAHRESIEPKRETHPENRAATRLTRSTYHSRCLRSFDALQSLERLPLPLPEI